MNVKTPILSKCNNSQKLLNVSPVLRHFHLLVRLPFLCDLWTRGGKKEVMVLWMIGTRRIKFNKVLKDCRGSWVRNIGCRNVIVTQVLLCSRSGGKMEGVVPDPGRRSETVTRSRKKKKKKTK